MIKELYCGDCTEVLKQLQSTGQKVDAVICGVPYGIGYTDWDNGFDLKQSMLICKEILKDNGNVIIFQGWSGVCDAISIMKELFVFQNWIVWDRIKGRGAKKNLVSTREDILWFSNGNDCVFNKMYSNIPKKTKGMGEKNGQANRALSNVWYDISPIVPWSKERNGHPTQKPLQLMERCVNLWTNEGDVVLDFCMGSGTTGEACMKLNRGFIGIEKEQQWFDVAQKRLNIYEE